MQKAIAIDGPAGAGKSTIAKLVASRLGFAYLDTGAMYRAVAYYCLQQGIDVHDEEAVVDALSTLHMEMRDNRLYLNGSDVHDFLRTQAVDRAVSPISNYAAVREHLVRQQRAIAEKTPSVLDGRDIGTVVLPQAALKFYLTATPEERARRRMNDAKTGEAHSFDEVLKDLLRRDENDKNRLHSPLRQAKDALRIDSTDCTIAQVVERMVQEAQHRGLTGTLPFDDVQKEGQ